MPTRRAIVGSTSAVQSGFSDLADYLANLMQLYSQRALMNETHRQDQQFELEKQRRSQEASRQNLLQNYVDRLSTLTNPDQRDQATKVGRVLFPSVGEDVWSQLQPSDAQMTEGLVNQIGGAKTPTEIPNVQTLIAKLQAMGRPSLTAGLDQPVRDVTLPSTRLPGMQTLGETAPETSGTTTYQAAQGKYANPALQTLMDLAGGREGQLRDETQRAMEEAGQKARLVAQGTAQGQTDVENQNFTTKLSHEQALEYMKLLAANSPQVGAAKAANERLLNPVLAARAGAEASARGAAEAPYQKPDVVYDTEGKAHAMRFGPGGATETNLPFALSGKAAPKEYGGTQAEQLAGINTADVEGVKILKQLHASGLDQSNDPADPRWQRFMVGTLKIAPKDFNKADIQQRAAFVNAAIMRPMMGGRPAQYIAQLLQQHLPSGDMTGQQLTHVLNNVLQQGAERREEIANVTNRPVKLPVSGEHYLAYKARTDKERADALQQLRSRDGGR